MRFKSYDSAPKLRPEGLYEVECVNCKQDETLRGDSVIKLDFLIREDVEQPCQRQHLFKSFFMDSDEWEEKFGRYANALGIPVGEEYELYDLIGKWCVASVKHYETDDGQKRECIFFVKKSELGAPKPIGSLDDLGDVSLDDIPFN